MKTSTMLRMRPLVMGGMASAVAAALVMACSDDTGVQPDLGDRSDSGPDVVANLPPDTNGDVDAGGDAAPEPRDPFDPADEPVACATDAASCAVQLVAGRNHFCARMGDGTVRCWGERRFGATGAAVLPDGGAAPAVRTIDGLTGVTQISAGGYTTCARLDDGSAKCWGGNQAGQLALSPDTPTSDSADHPVPSTVSVDEPISRIDVGDRVVCAVLASGETACWGENYTQQISQRASAVAVPTKLEAGTYEFSKLAMGSTTSFGITKDGKVASWGALNGRQGIIGGRLASVTPDGRPILVDQLQDVTSLAASTTLDRHGEGRLSDVTFPTPPPGGALPHAHACAIAGGEVHCWGSSDYGALCTGLFDVERLPAHAPIRGKAWPQQLAVGDELTCARMTDGSIQCCGVDFRGRLGVGFSTLFVKLDAFTGYAVQVATSHRAICALVQGGTVECWGNNQYGELGQETTDENAHPTPVKVAF